MVLPRAGIHVQHLFQLPTDHVPLRIEIGRVCAEYSSSYLLWHGGIKEACVRTASSGRKRKTFRQGHGQNDHADYVVRNRRNSFPGQHLGRGRSRCDVAFEEPWSRPIEKKPYSRYENGLFSS